MWTPTGEELDHMREAILNLARIECERKQLSPDSLMLAFHLLAYGAPVTHYRDGKSLADYLIDKFPPDPENWLGYVGACWVVEDHF